MANIEYFHDACKTAADVMARAHEVMEKRRHAFSKPQVVYIREPTPEPKIIVKTVKPSVIEMLQAVADHYKVEHLDILEILEEAHARGARRRLAQAYNFRMRTIQEAVCAVMGVSLNDLLSARREKPIILPRHIAMFLCKKYLTKSLPEIGHGFGHRDHTTVLHAIRKIDELSRSDPDVQETIMEIEKMLGFVKA